MIKSIQNHKQMHMRVYACISSTLTTIVNINRRLLEQMNREQYWINSKKERKRDLIVLKDYMHV